MMTAYSLWVEANHLGPVTNSDTMGAWAWIDNYCRDNPLKEGLPSGGLGEVGSMMPVISYAFLRLPANAASRGGCMIAIIIA